MSEKPEESFDDDEDDNVADGGEGIDLDELIRDLETGKKRRGARVSTADPAWRKLERYLEEKRTAEQMSDFDDYDIGDEGAAARPRRNR